MARLIAYVVKHDYGFASNPFGGFLTLATCKPKIRSAAEVGDILMGTGAVKNVGVGKLICAARVTEIVDTETYDKEERFAVKRPVVGQGAERQRGDNVYSRVDGKWHQITNPFHDEANLATDLSSLRVLVCADFWYFGNKAVDLSAYFPEVVKKGPGCKYTRDVHRVRQVEAWLEGYAKGLHGAPSRGGSIA